MQLLNFITLQDFITRNSFYTMPPLLQPTRYKYTTYIYIYICVCMRLCAYVGVCCVILLFAHGVYAWQRREKRMHARSHNAATLLQRQYEFGKDGIVSMNIPLTVSPHVQN